MSMDLYIFLADSRVPGRAAWQKAIDEHGFATTLDENFDVRNDRGFRPAKYEGQETGFEFYLGAAAGVLPTYPHVAARIGARDKCATFTWGGDLTEMYAALTAAAALAKLSDAIWFYPADNSFCSADEALDEARAASRVVKSIDRRIKKREVLRWTFLILAAMAIVFMLFAR